MPGGRPSKYTEEIATKICAQIANGKSLRKICEAKDMPSIEAVRLWLADETKAKFLGQYVRAREEQADFYADEIIERADKAFDKDSSAAAKVQVDARKWVASKLKPKRYGEHLDVSATSEITHKWDDMTDEQLDAAIKARQNRLA